MPTISATTRRRLEIQGFVGLDDQTLAETGPWLRLTFALCTGLAAIGALFASPLFLWALMPIAALAAVFPVHPFDLLYNYGLRHLTGTGPLPKRGAPSRFACGLGATGSWSPAGPFRPATMWPDTCSAGRSRWWACSSVPPTFASLQSYTGASSGFRRDRAATIPERLPERSRSPTNRRQHHYQISPKDAVSF
jgi:hypothetical protein